MTTFAVLVPGFSTSTHMFQPFHQAMSMNDFEDRIMLIYFAFGRVPPEMFVFMPDSHKIIALDYDKEGSEMAVEAKRMVVYDDAASMVVAFPGINYLQINKEPVRWNQT